ncbi:general odorant-binding protein 69-like [Armigeres subalbatus]|uniref:general odorant-binding protein 69-like n=1 Tax=Armigeres subalbatus TaxID=124917 RepID=UPI002ED10ADB
MGLTSASTVVVILSCLSVARCDLPHYTLYSNMFNYLQECALYFEIPKVTLDRYIQDCFPDTPETRRLVHCALVDSGAWDDRDGLGKSVIQFLFKPNKTDTVYEERTQSCLDRIGTGDQNYLAYETFLCYYRYYGQMTNEEVYNPMEPLEINQILLFVQRVLNVSSEQLSRFGQSDHMEDPLFKQVIFIGSLRMGIYSWDKGFLSDVAYEQFNIPELRSPSTEACVARVSSKYRYWDKQQQWFEVYKQCLATYLDSLMMNFFQKFLNPTVCSQGLPNLV